MTQNRRYDSRLDENLARAERLDASRGTPVPLSPEELRTTGRRVEAREPVSVEAWIRHRVVYEEPRLIQGVAVAWTTGAVLIRWSADGVERFTWVWASAVRRHSL
ncbi:hypothetical protein GCM10009717_21580 [Agromyces allii]|uniref:Transposase n=1 Tax=Agromyces allii TaxID=393607 RepID=A0ABN2QMT9_9MICO